MRKLLELRKIQKNKIFTYFLAGLGVTAIISPTTSMKRAMKLALLCYENRRWKKDFVREDAMDREENRWSGFGWNIGIAIFANLLAGFVATGTFFLVIKLYGKTISEQPTIKLIASVSAILFWCISYGLAVLLVRKAKRFKKNLKYLGYYFPLTTLFAWAFDQRSFRLKAEEKLRRLEKIVEGWPDVRIISGIIDSEKQKETLNKTIDDIDNMEDHTLAQILENIRRYADDILGSVGTNGNYDLFRQVMERVSLSKPNDRPETYTRFLWLLSDVFRMPPEGCFTRGIQKNMVGTLKHAIWRVDRPHLNRIGTIIEQIMIDEEYEQYLASQILEMLLGLDPKKNREVWQIIFDNSIKRAFLFPQYFGLDLLLKLGELKHKVFWLDIQSLMSILEQAVENSEKALIILKPKAYDALCSKVFAPIEDKEHAGRHNCRVFRRLEGEDGRVHVECILPDDKKCNCEGESLSFRGLYSKKCDRKVDDKFKAKVIPIVEIGQAKPKHEFAFAVSVAKLHPSDGRGIFFEDAEEDVVEGLYEYISEHRK